jgi:malate/lactate dehydrogenase
MKAAIIGVGAVGAATAMAIALRSCVRELILIGAVRECPQRRCP